MEYYLDNYRIDIDRCINTKSEYDFAILIHKCFKEKYYYENNEWFILNENKEKIKDIKSESLTNDITDFIGTLIHKRSEYWDILSKKEIDENIQSDYYIKSNLLINSATKIKTNQTFVKNIIKECKTFFYIMK